MRLFAMRDLSVYDGWKGDEEAIRKEFDRNREVGLECDSLRSGVLYHDEDGVVDKILASDPTVGKVLATEPSASPVPEDDDFQASKSVKKTSKKSRK